jgi:hypothetical protein
MGVDALRLERQPVPRSLREHDVAAERLAKGRDAVLKRPRCRCGRPLAPQIGDEPIGRDHFARPQRERGQQRALLPARQRNHAFAVTHLEHAEEPNLHSLFVTPKTKVSK